MTPDPTIVDTVVLRYFLLVDRFELLMQILGRPVMVSRIVYDPEDAGDERAMSEITRSVYVQSQRAVDPRRTEEEQQRAELFARRLELIHEHFYAGFVSIVDMSEEERSLYGRLSAREHAAEFGLTFSLDDGEAASLAIALERGWVFASDDSDALRAKRAIHRNHPYQRIRKVLVEAADGGLISRADANAIHEEMRRAGFWDINLPFPKEDL